LLRKKAQQVIVMPVFSKHTEYEAFISIEVKSGIFYKRNMCSEIQRAGKNALQLLAFCLRL
jgi:hypothetical protein